MTICFSEATREVTLEVSVQVIQFSSFILQLGFDNYLFYVLPYNPIILSSYNNSKIVKQKWKFYAITELWEEEYKP